MKTWAMVLALKIVSIKNAFEIKGIKIHIHWHAKQHPVWYYSSDSPQWDWKKLTAAYTDVSKSSLEMICWLHDLTQRRKTFQSSTKECKWDMPSTSLHVLHRSQSMAGLPKEGVAKITMKHRQSASACLVRSDIWLLSLLPRCSLE